TPEALTYQIKERTILIAKSNVTPEKGSTGNEMEPTQERIVTGRVSDEQGNPLAGVTVSIKGASVAVTTDASGNYRLPIIQVGTKLVFYMMGYNTLEQPAGIDSTVHVTMTPAVSDLEEVVVVGYGAVRKSDLTGSVAQVKTAQLEVVPVYNVEQALKAGATGVRVVQNSGAPGSRIQVRIRGGNSMI